MEDKETLIEKAKGLRRRARLPKFLNHFGPKRHPLWQFILGQLVQTTYCHAWRRTAKFMKEFYDLVLHWTEWQKAIAKWPFWVWQALGQASVGEEPCIVAAIDGTTFSRSNPSEHYLKRIDREGSVGRPIQDVALVDVVHRKFLAWRIRAVPKGEKRDVPYLIRMSPTLPGCVLMDKGFDSNPLHTWFHEHGIWSVAPVRKGCKRGQFRRRLRDNFDWPLYRQRNLVEALFSAVKRLFGTYVRARAWKSQYAELSARMIAYNVGAVFDGTFY